MPETHSLGPFDIICEDCQALKFNEENHFQCCHKGKVILLPLQYVPDEIKELYCSDSKQAKEFRKLIRQYNNCFSFVSMAANIRPPPNRGPPCFRICGQIHHRYGALFPPQNSTPAFNQLYIIDAAVALNTRMANPSNGDLNRDVVQIIQNVLNTVNPYAAG